MRILRKIIQKMFRKDEDGNIIRDPLPNILFKPDPKLEETYGKCNLIIQTSKKFDRDSNKIISPIDKLKIRSLLKDIKNAYLYDNGKTIDSDTHYLSRFSKTGPTYPYKSHLVSKRITYTHRLNYRIYEPVVEELPDGTFDYYIKIVLESCFGHGRNGAPDYYKDI